MPQYLSSCRKGRRFLLTWKEISDLGELDRTGAVTEVKFGGAEIVVEDGGEVAQLGLEHELVCLLQILITEIYQFLNKKSLFNIKEIT